MQAMMAVHTRDNERPGVAESTPFLVTATSGKTGAGTMGGLSWNRSRDVRPLPKRAVVSSGCLPDKKVLVS